MNKPISLIIFLIFFISCTTDSTTQYSDSTDLTKPIEHMEEYDITTTDFDTWMNLWLAVFDIPDEVLGTGVWGLCFFAWLGGFDTPPSDLLPNYNSQSSDLYDFRNNYLAKSKKGTGYIVSYYSLSDYGINNNLVVKYYKEHLSLMNVGMELSKELQYGKNPNRILINNSTKQELSNLLTVYRQSENHNEIDKVLNFLEFELNQYHNKTISKIRLDFQ